MEIVHVMGMSCVGKRTLIDQLMRGDPETRLVCGITGSCAAFFGSGRDATRHSAAHWQGISGIFSATGVDHVLNKWQIEPASLIADLFSLRPDVPQRGIVLWRTSDDNADRIGESPTHTIGWDGYREGMPKCLTDIRRRVQAAEKLGVCLEHFDVTGCADNVIRLDRPLPGIPSWVSP